MEKYLGGIFLGLSVVAFGGETLEYTIFINNEPAAVILIEKRPYGLDVSYKSLYRLDLPFYAERKTIKYGNIQGKKSVIELEIFPETYEVEYDLSQLSPKELLALGLNPRRAKSKALIKVSEGNTYVIDKYPVHTFESVLVNNPKSKFYLFEPLSKFKVLFVKLDNVEQYRYGTCNAEEYVYRLVRRPVVLFKNYKYGDLTVGVKSGSGKWEIRLTGYGQRKLYVENIYDEVDKLLSEQLRRKLERFKNTDYDFNISEGKTSINRLYAIKSASVDFYIDDDLIKDYVKDSLEKEGYFSVKNVKNIDVRSSYIRVNFDLEKICRTFFEENLSENDSLTLKEFSKDCREITLKVKSTINPSIEDIYINTGISDSGVLRVNRLEDMHKGRKSHEKICTPENLGKFVQKDMVGLVSIYLGDVVVPEGYTISGFSVGKDEKFGSCRAEYEATLYAKFDIDKFIKKHIGKTFYSIEGDVLVVALDKKAFAKQICEDVSKETGLFLKNYDTQKCEFAFSISKPVSEIKSMIKQRLISKYPQIKILGEKVRFEVGENKFLVKYSMIERFNECSY